MKRLTTDYRLLAIAIFILLLATTLRFHRLDAQSFWNDEGNSARLSERSLPLIIEGTASDIHPPLYYLLLRGWREELGESEFALRALSAFLGIGVVALTITLANQLQTFAFSTIDSQNNPKSSQRRSYTAPLLVALLTAVNPALVYYSQEARMYQLLAFLGMLSTVLLIHWLKNGTNLKSKTAVLYILSLTAGLYTHYFFPAVIITHALLLIYPLQKSPAHLASLFHRVLRWLPLPITAVLLYLPWLPIFIRQAGGRPAIRPPLFEFLADVGRFLTLGSTIEPENVTWPLATIGLLLVVGLLPRGRRWSVGQYTTFCAVTVTVMLMWLAGTTTPPLYKFMLMAVPPLLLLAVYGFNRVAEFAENSQHRALFFVALSLVGLFLLGNYTSVHNMYNNPTYARADYRAIAAQITADNADTNSAVILNAANQWEVFTYYYEDVGSVYPLPRGFPDPAQIEAELLALTEQYGRLYAIFWGEAERDPDRLVERWLDANAFKAEEEWVGDVRLVTYAVPSEPPGEMETAVNVTFGESIKLEGYTIRPEIVQPGEVLQVSLFWQTAVPLNTRYKVFLHLIGPEDQRWSQRDSEPGGNLALTTTWTPNETIQDNHGLLVPPDAPSGEYILLLGLYNIADPNARLMVETADGPTEFISIPIQVNQNP